MAVVEAIGDHARTVNLDRAAQLDQALVAIAAGRISAADLQAATEVAHRLVGSAGTFGLPGASQVAGEIERYFIEGDFDDPDRLTRARDQVRRLQDELAARPDYQPEDEDDPTS
ncbi:MAG TPA: Hpt domain-containing protein [Propionibacteriaceae bacterium]|jgi:HPt (histidine-containing phosphotransfer) domain-containing protein|nr:Hpt domain-containing protein [Propionibacteriaceae bacterium]